MQVSLCAARLRGALPDFFFLPLCSDRPNPNDHAEPRTSHQAKQIDGKCSILGGTLRWLPPPMRCLCSLLIQVIIMKRDFNHLLHTSSY